MINDLLRTIQSELDSDRAMQFLEGLNAYDRMQVTPGYTAAADYILKQMTGLGLDTEMLSFPATFGAEYWTALMFQPADIANNLKENGGFVPGLRPGKRTADYLENVMYRVTLAGAFFLAVIAVIPQVISAQLKNIPSYIAVFLGGTSILIVVGVILDLVDKLNSQLLMRNYEGFVAGGASSAWARGRKR